MPTDPAEASEYHAVDKHARLLGFVLLCCWCVGCTSQRRIDLMSRTGGNAFLFGQFQAFDGATGRALRFPEVVRRCRSADVVLFGEQHGNAICAQLEAQVFWALLDTGRPLMLAMEFFEADTQAALDAYLTGRIDELALLEQTRQRTAYAHTHRPLIELSRAGRVPVTAANAPRRLVSAYRQSGLTYREYHAGLDSEDQRWLPVTSEPLEGPYRERFAEIMRAHTAATKPASQPSGGPASQPAMQPASQPVTRPASQPVTRPATEVPATMPVVSRWQDYYKAQLLWDDAIAESIADFRARFGRHRVLLVVGSFHVAHDGGTAIKLRQRRPRDKLCTIVYRASPDGRFTFREEDRGAGDIVLYGLTPPEPEEKTMPGKEPATRPASAPASGPTSAPTTTSAPAAM